jgi:hypothetical protein
MNVTAMAIGPIHQGTPRKNCNSTPGKESCLRRAMIYRRANSSAFLLKLIFRKNSSFAQQTQLFKQRAGRKRRAAWEDIRTGGDYLRALQWGRG